MKYTNRMMNKICRKIKTGICTDIPFGFGFIVVTQSSSHPWSITTVTIEPVNSLLISLIKSDNYLSLIIASFVMTDRQVNYIIISGPS